MTIAKALNRFLSSFGIPAYEETDVFSGENAPDYPFITYTSFLDEFESENPVAFSIWMRTKSMTDINALARRILQEVGKGGKMIQVDGGGIWIKAGHPFSQPVSSPDDDIRRLYCQLIVEVIT